MQPPYNLTSEILSLVSDISILIGQGQALQMECPSPMLRNKHRIKTIRASLAQWCGKKSLQSFTAPYVH
jgi:hypothetical protein